MSDPKDDPILDDDGYPSEAELARIRGWGDDLIALMAYVKKRWAYDAWEEEDIAETSTRAYRQFTISTYGWSGNESLIGALEDHTMFSFLAPWSWRRGGHYVYRLALPKETR